MLISLPPLGDMSRFVRQKDRVELHETVLLLVDGSPISCSGAILAARSSVLKTQLSERYKIYLDQYSGMSEQMYQCLELLYGGAVPLDFSNIRCMLRFSVEFDILDLITICLDWLDRKGVYSDTELLTEPDPLVRLRLVEETLFTLDLMLSRGGISSNDDESDDDTDSISDMIPEQQVSEVEELLSETPRNHRKEDWDFRSFDSCYSKPLSAPIDNKVAQDRAALLYLGRASPNLIQNPDHIFTFDVSCWRTFTEEQLLAMCQPQCKNFDYIKIEVLIGWLQYYAREVEFAKYTFENLLSNMDPKGTPMRYLRIIHEYLDLTYDRQIEFPHEWNMCMGSVYYSPDAWSDECTLLSHLWRINDYFSKAFCHRERRSLYTSCPVCPETAGKQELVFKFAPNSVPMYDLHTDGCLDPPISPNSHLQHRVCHYHPGSVVHWIIRVGAARGEVPLQLISLVTSDPQTVRNAIHTQSAAHGYVRIICFQSKDKVIFQ